MEIGTWYFTFVSSVILFYHISIIPLQLVYCQCILSIQLHEFQNIHSAEIRQINSTDVYCCCDQGDDYCEENLPQLSTTTCGSTNPCDTYFVATLSTFLPSDSFSAMLSSDTFHNSSSTDVNYKFQFFLTAVPSELVIYIAKCVCVLIIIMCVYINTRVCFCLSVAAIYREGNVIPLCILCQRQGLCLARCTNFLTSSFLEHEILYAPFTFLLGFKLVVDVSNDAHHVEKAVFSSSFLNLEVNLRSLSFEGFSRQFCWSSKMS